MARYLALYDLSGIQRFIFQTNRLKEVAGASYLVSEALFGNVPRLAGEAQDAWRTRQVKEYADLGPDDARVVYIGGGNALVLFGSEKKALCFSRELKKKVFLRTGGALRVCSALVEVHEGQRLDEVLDPLDPEGLRSRLARSKAKAPQALTARGFSVDRLDNETFEPILYFEQPLNDRGESLNCLPRGRRLKLEEYRDVSQHRSGHASPLADIQGDRLFQVDADGFFKDSDMRKRFLAVVHADGNTMGRQIARFLAKSRERSESFEQDLADMRDMSAYIGSIYGRALGQMIDEVYGTQEEGVTLPFRLVVADGDDITFICTSDKAFECVDRLIHALDNPRGETLWREGLPRPDELSVGVGIAFVKAGYPFSSAYDMAEELCKNAKGAAIERFGKDAGPISSIDFHVCTGELTADIADFRQRNLVQERKDGTSVSLCLRPYHVGKAGRGDATEGNVNFEDFLNLLWQLQEHSTGERPWMARGRLKGLRDSYGEGYDRTVAYTKSLAERNSAIQRGRNEGELAEEGRAAFIDAFLKPYVGLDLPGQDGDGPVFARFFDVLDVLDICRGRQAGTAWQGEGENHV